MSNLLVYTEAYARGGGNSYLVDLVNSVSGLYEHTTLASNPGGLFDEDLARLAGKHPTHVVSIVSVHRAYADLHERAPRRAALSMREIQRFEGLAFEYNVHLLRRLIRRVRATAVLSCNGGYPAAPSALAMVVAAHREGVPVALSVVSMPEPRREGRFDRDRRTDDLVWSSVDAVIVNARCIAPALVEMHDMPSRLARVVRNGIAEYSPPSLSPETSATVVVGSVSRMETAKGTEHLVEAFARLAGEHPAAKLVMVGEGSGRKPALELLASRGLSDRAELPGWVAGDVGAVLAGFDIFVLPSLWEGLPYAILEAMRAGLAIVSTDVGGIPEAIEDGVTGLLVPPASTEALASAIGRLLDDPGLRERLGRAARERFETDFSLAAMQDAAVRVFKEAGLA